MYDFTCAHKPEFRIICTSPDQLDEKTRVSFENLKLPDFFIPTTVELSERKT